MSTVNFDARFDDGFVDITDPDIYIKGVPHTTFKRLRDEAPVSWTPEKDGRGFWSITRYDDIIAVSQNSKVFSVSKGIRLEDMDEEETQARLTMMELDPPEHTNYRRLVNPPFSRAAVQAYEGVLREMARQVINEAKSNNEFDFVEDIARKVPMLMLGKLLGTPDEDGPWLVEKGDALLGNSDPEFTDYPVDLVDTDEYRLMPFRSPAGMELFDYAAKQVQARLDNPKDDVISRLLQPLRDGSKLDEHAFKNFFTLLVAAGNDTTRYTMTVGLDALLENPEQLAALKTHPELMDSAVEEMLRWGTVTMHFRRTAMEDVELRGQKIKAGDKIIIWYISGDYDEREFDDPFKFDIKRSPNKHMAFGLKSPHKCLGEHLARLEIKVTMQELLPQLASVELNGTPERLRSNFISGIKHLPIKVQWV